MTLRRNHNRRGSLDTVIAEVPARFREVEVYHDLGKMTGLGSYIADLTEHLRQELGTGDPPTIEVMTMLGIPPSESFRALLTSEDDNRDRSETNV